MWCFTRISGPEKSRNLRYFSTVIDDATFDVMFDPALKVAGV